MHWRRDSKQNRSEKTQAALLDAAEELIVEKGVDGASITEIAKRAGASVGAVYHHFKDKTALRNAVFHRMTSEIADTNKQAADPARWKDASALEMIDAFISFRLHQTKAGGMSKRATALVMADDPDLKAHMAEIKREGNQRLLDLLLTRKEDITHPDPELAAAFVIDQLSAMFYARTDPYQKPSALADPSDDVFKAEAIKWATAVLGLRS